MPRFGGAFFRLYAAPLLPLFAALAPRLHGERFVQARFALDVFPQLGHAVKDVLPMAQGAGASESGFQGHQDAL
ncbi:hypothetical protein CQ050_14520 [Achromobacter sp. MYb9]|uniref:hypothetical protein n=1 Tax=Achromobacter sp. MYb9 TaxID=1827284 RepID=UPI000CFAFF33|nr:hypothetical protein [Achromobacter sp. MYb9]PQZ68449.1 hypothetical protein CQ050_14520 [Achromobacter sp. MYb9]